MYHYFICFKKNRYALLLLVMVGDDDRHKRGTHHVDLASFKLDVNTMKALSITLAEEQVHFTLHWVPPNSWAKDQGILHSLTQHQLLERNKYLGEERAHAQ